MVMLVMHGQFFYDMWSATAGLNVVCTRMLGLCADRAATVPLVRLESCPRYSCMLWKETGQMCAYRQVWIP